jgi:hypothetical protein
VLLEKSRPRLYLEVTQCQEGEGSKPVDHNENGNYENQNETRIPQPRAESRWLLAGGVRAGHGRSRQGSDREVLSGEAAIFSIRGETVSNARLLG